MSYYLNTNYTSSTDSDTEDDTNIDIELTEITNILEKTILLPDIINYIVNDFIDPRYKCVPCNTKFERYCSNYCQKCKIKCCDKCLLKVTFKKTYKVCYKCYPTITDIYSLFKYTCYNCNESSNNENYYHNCIRCDKSICNLHITFSNHCQDCYQLVKDTIDISEFEDLDRCERCNDICDRDDDFRLCKTCEEVICRVCSSWCDKCSNDTCNTCLIKCTSCKFECCNQCNTRSSKCNCNYIICDKCCSKFDFDNRTYRCKTCNYKFKDN